MVVRHGPAEDRGPDLPDEARSLTPRGRLRMRRVARALDARGLAVDRLLHSPLLRAVETADTLRRLVRGETEVCPGLAGTPDEALLAALVGERVAVVGHEPWLGQLVAWLVVGDPGLGARFPLKKGGVFLLEGAAAPGGMVLRSAWPPGTWR